MQTEAEARLTQITALFSAMQGAWPAIAVELGLRQQDLIASLISQNNDETRGRIKQLNDLIDLPNSIYQEMQNLKQPLPDQGG